MKKEKTVECSRCGENIDADMTGTYYLVSEYSNRKLCLDCIVAVSDWKEGLCDEIFGDGGYC